MSGDEHPIHEGSAILSSLEVPVVGAPMAGGPGTPELAAAVSNTGGIGSLAAGYLSVEALAGQIAETRRLTDRPFAVNVFVPDAEIDADLSAYRSSLLTDAERFGVDLPEAPAWSDDCYAAKIDLLTADPVAVVSFTFGAPDREVVERLHEAGSEVWVSVTNGDDALLALAAGADALCAQGVEAGGHRSTFEVTEEPNADAVRDVLASVVAVAGDTPVIAAGGIATRAGARELLDAGAAAVQIGTALLLTQEAGTSATHRAALQDARFTSTALTRAFSGRPARGLENRFIREHRDAPAVYPAVNTLVGPLKRAAGKAGDPEYVNLWAGESWQDAREGSAASVVREIGGASDGAPADPGLGDRGSRETKDGERA